MRRDMDLVRAVLLHLESSPGIDADVAELVQDLEAAGYDREKLSYHFELMAEAGLIKGFDVGAATVGWLPQRMSWLGHEFLDAARSEERWNDAKRLIRESGDSASFEMWREILSELARDAMRTTKRAASKKPGKGKAARRRRRA